MKRVCRYHAVKALLDLPDDLLVVIFSRLYPTGCEFADDAVRSTRDVLNLSQTCGRLNRLFRRTKRAFLQAPRTLDLQYPAARHALLCAPPTDIAAATFILCQGRRSLRCVRLTALGEAHLEVMALVFRCEQIGELQFVDEAEPQQRTGRDEANGALSLVSFVPLWFGQRLRRLVIVKPSRETIGAFARAHCSPGEVSLFRIAPGVMRESTKGDLARLLRNAWSFSVSFAEDLPMEQTHRIVQRLGSSLWAMRRHLPTVRVVDRGGGARFTRHARVRFVRDEKVRLSEWLSGLGGLQRFPPAAALDAAMRERLMLEVDSVGAAARVVEGGVQVRWPRESAGEAAARRAVSGQAVFLRDGGEGATVLAGAFNVARQIGATEVVLSAAVAACAAEAAAAFAAAEVAGWFGATRAAGWPTVAAGAAGAAGARRVDVGVVAGDGGAPDALLDALPALLRVARLLRARALWLEHAPLRLRGAPPRARLVASARRALHAARRADAAGLHCASLRGALLRWLTQLAATAPAPARL